jgi:hypothetical protein
VIATGTAGDGGGEAEDGTPVIAAAGRRPARRQRVEYRP